MEVAVRRMLLIYEAEPPAPLLLARLSQYDADLVPAQKFDVKLSPPNLHSYDVFLVYTPGNLHRGRAVCDSLRQLSAAPILLIAPAKPVEEAAQALHQSVDVLLPPDIDPAIVAGHVASLMRCKQAQPALLSETGSGAPNLYRDDALEINLVRRSVKVDGRLVHLTPTEFRFMALLVLHAGELLTYDEILNYVWGWEATEHRIVHTFAAQIRAKLGQRGAAYLVNEYGSGYRFSPPE